MVNPAKHPRKTKVIPLLLLLLYAAFCLAPSACYAQDGWESLDFRTVSDWCGPYTVGTYEARDSSVAYCMNQDRFGPSQPGGPWLTYSQGWVWLEDAYAAVVCNGYPVATNFGGHNLSAERARAVTQIAIWMLNGTTNTDGSYSFTNYDGKAHTGSFSKDPEVTAAARWLCDSARSGAIKAAPHRARRYLGPTVSTTRQDMLYVLPTCTANFEKRSANASITLGNASYSLAHASFDIFEAAGDTKVASIKTDANGTAQATLLPNTAYYLLETAAPQGYLKREDRISFTTTASGARVGVDEVPGSINLTLIKLDAATGGAAQAGANLADAEFSCTSLSTKGWTRTISTDGAGKGVLEGIPLGTYTIRETRAPEGYLPSKETWTYTVGSEQLGAAGTVELECRISNVPIAFDLEISKFKDNGGEGSGLEQPAGGVRFELISNSTGQIVGELTTNVYGFTSSADSADAWFGSGAKPQGAHGAIPFDRCGYTVREVEETVPTGFSHAGDWTISPEQIADGAKLQYIVDNHALSTHLQIVKRDRSTGLTVPLSGFTFNLLDDQKNPISQTVWYPNHSVLNSFTTDGTGTVTLPESLKPGTYFIREISAQPPYLIGDDARIEIPADQQLTPVVIASFYDRRATGSVKIKKTDAVNGNALVGATFEIRAAETITEPDGSIAATEGETIGRITTDQEGIATLTGLSLGCGTARYVAAETDAPDGYLLDSEEHAFELSYLDASTDVVLHEIAVENDYTKLDISKLDATDAHEIAGAELSLIDSAGNIVESWVSKTEPHRIEHLSPGTYTLRETMSPRTYDMAEEVTFELEATGKVQKVEMKDKPIKISGAIDKRQEIARPAHGLVAGVDSCNRAKTQEAADGTYSYTIDFLNTSNTWVDECTVTDELKAAATGAAELKQISTPVVRGDHDGLMNVWYRTSGGPTDDDDVTTEGDNDTVRSATIDDGHDNPWLESDEVAGLLGDDRRQIDYRGWRLWKADVPTGESVDLKVADLDLKPKERVVAVRFEYGCVDETFTTRSDKNSWKRDDLKDEHDDIDSVAADIAEGDEVKAAVITMRAASGYCETNALENSAQIDLVRNGGGEDLEAHDDDRVVQRCAPMSELPQTGSLPWAAAITALITTGCAILAISWHRRR